MCAESSTFAQQITPNPLGSQILPHPMSTGSTVRKTQTIYLPGDFLGNTQSGFITHIYLRGFSLNILNLTVNDLEIKMGQRSVASFTAGQFFDSLQPVLLPQAQRIFSAAQVVGSYLRIPLDIPIQYNHTLPLVVEISSSSANNTFNAAATTRTGQRLWSSQPSASSGTVDNLQLNLGFDIIIPNGPNAAIQSLIKPQSNLLNTGKYPVELQIRNLSGDTLRQLQVDWSFGSQAASAVWTGHVLPGQSFNYQFADSISVQSRRSDTLKIWSSLPNGLPDVAPGNDSLFRVIQARLEAGVYSVGLPNSDFPLLQSAINLLNNAGFSGNLVFELENGLHQANILLTPTMGVDSLSQIHFKSKTGNADSVVIRSTSAPTIQANGASFVRFSNVTLQRSGLQNSTSSGVVQLQSGRQWRFEGCKFEVINNDYSVDLLSQRNVFLTLINDVVFNRCHFVGGSYALTASGNTAFPMRNLSIDSSSIIETVAGIYHLSRLNNFSFTQNTVVKSSELGSGNNQMHLHYTNGITITHNYIDVTTNFNLWFLFSANRLTPQSVNLIANNVIRMRQLGFGALLAFDAASFNEPPNSFQFEHNNVWASTEVNTHTNTWRMIGVQAFFAQSFNGCNIVNNIFEWHHLGPANFGSFYGTVHPISSLNLMQVNRNLYRLPAINRYAHDQNSNTMHRMGFYQGWDTHSQVMSFNLDSLRAYRIDAPVNSRWSSTSSSVTTDYTGRTRQVPQSDIGAYEEPLATRPLLLAQTLPDTVGMQPRSLLVQGLTEQPGDTLDIRLYYKLSTQSTWVHVSSISVGNQRYQLTLDYRRLGVGLAGPLTIEYFYLYRIPGQAWSSLPLGGDTASAPVQLYRFRLTDVLSSQIRVGNQGDVPDIQSAFAALANNTVRQPVTFLLTDSLYLIPANSVELSNFVSTDPSFAVVFRPAFGRNVVIRDPIGNKWAIRLNRILHFQIQGRDTAGTGSLTFEMAGTTGGAILLPNQNSLNDRFVAENITFRSLTPNNTSTAIYAGGTQSIIGTTLHISSCRFLGFSPALHLLGVRNGLIEHNVFGDSVALYPFTSTIVTIGAAQQIEFQNNLIQNLRYPTDRLTMYLLNIEGAVNSLHVLNNRFLNIGFDSLFQNSNNFSPRRAAIIHFTQRYDTLRVIGNVMQGLSLPVNRAQSGNSIKEWYLVYDNRSANSPPANRFDFLHNTVLSSAKYFGNCRSRFYGFRLNNVFQPNIHNNLFGLDLQGDPAFFRGSLFIPGNQPSFIFDSLRISHNVYLLDSAATFAYLLQADSIALTDIANWRNHLARPGFQREQVAYQLQGALSTFLISGQMPNPLLASYVDSNALPLLLPFAATNDLNQQPRLPADIGAMQVQSAGAVDNDLPIISNVVFDTTLFACITQSRTFSAQVSDVHSGVQSVHLSLWNGQTARIIPLNLIAGNSQSGTWAATVPSDTSIARASAHIRATDFFGNTAYSVESMPYHNFDLKYTIQSSSFRNTQNPIQASASIRGNTSLAISEFGYLRSAPGFSTTLPPFADATRNNYIEITNYGLDTADMAGFRLRLTSLDTLTFPAPYQLPPGGVILITGGTLAANTANHYFTHPALSSLNMLNSNVALVLLNAQRDEIIDAVYIHSSSFSPITPVAGSWVGNPIFISNRMGGFKLMGMDLNNASNWLPIDANNPGDLGTYHLLSTRKPAIQLQWGGILQGTGRTASRPPLAGGNYFITLQSSNGFCSAIDSFLVRVSGNDSTDFVAPWVSSPVYAPTFSNISCNDQARTITLRVRDTSFGSGVAEVWLLLEHAMGSNTYRMSRITGTDLDGEYQLDLRNVRFSGRLQALAIDRAGNRSDTLSLRYFHGLLYGVTASSDTTITLGSNLTLSARASRADRSALQLTEVVYQTGSSVQPNLPTGMVLTGSPDVFEITNMGHESLSTAGIILRLLSGSTTHSIPIPATSIPPQGQIFMVIGGTAMQTAPNIFWVTPTPLGVSSSSTIGILLVDTLAQQPYLTSLGLNNYTFPTNLNIPNSIWSGPGIGGLSGTAGVFRVNNNPNNSGWLMTNISLGRLTNLGSSVMFPQQTDSIQWFSQGFLLGTADSLVVTPTQNTLFVARASNGSCTATDTIFVEVQGATQQFDVAMLSISAPQANTTNPAQVFPSIRLRNGGAAAISAIPLEFSVNGQLMFRDTLNTLLGPSDTAHFASSRAWQVPLGGVHVFCVKSALPGDILSSNDSICIQTLGRDAQQFTQLGGIVHPATGTNVRDSSQVQVRIINAGTDTLQSVRLSFADSLQPPIEQLFSVLLAPGQQQTLTFTRFYIPSDSMSNRLCVRLLGAWPDSLCVPLGGLSTSLTTVSVLPQVQVYPNPTENTVFVQVAPTADLQRILILDVSGKELLVYDPVNSSEQHALETRHLASGLYLIRIQTSVGTVIKRLVIQR